MAEALTNQLAEIIGAVLESITMLNEVAATRHSIHLLRHSRDDAAPGTTDFAFFEKERVKAEADLERSNGELLRSLRKLEAMKLILEGKPTDEIRAKFAEDDSVGAAFIEKIRSLRE